MEVGGVVVGLIDESLCTDAVCVRVCARAQTRAQWLNPVLLFATPWIDCSPDRLLYPWDLPGKNTGVGCHFLLQGIFPTQGFILCLLHGQVDSLLLSHQGSPRVPSSRQVKLFDGRHPD